MEDESADSPGTPGTPLEGSSRESSAEIQGRDDYEKDPGQSIELDDVDRAAEGLSDAELSPPHVDSPGPDSPAPDTSRELEPDDDDDNDTKVRGAGDVR